MNDLQKRKKQLSRELKTIAEQEQKAMVEKYYPEFKKLEGTFWKIRNNYSLPQKPSDYFWLYTKITEVKPEDVYDTGGNGITSHVRGWSFQTCKYGIFTVEKQKAAYAHHLGQQITEEEFNDAWNAAIDSLDKLK